MEYGVQLFFGHYKYKLTSNVNKPCSQGELRGVILLLHICLHLTCNLDSTRALGMAQVANRSSTGQLIRQTKMLFHHEDNLKRLSDPTEVAKLGPIHALLHWAPHGSVILYAPELVPP